MNKYLFRSNFNVSFLDQLRKIRAKIVVKTLETHWVNTSEPVVITVSIHSAFHDNYEGDLKMNALVSTIKKNVNGKVTILFTERAKELNFRYQPYFEGCNVMYWHSYICTDPHLEYCQKVIKNLITQDRLFQQLVQKDAESCYTEDRKLAYPDEDLFMKKNREDIIEHCVCWLVLMKKGYRFQFYPGRPYTSMEYVAKYIAKDEKKLEWIHVFLSVEKKVEQM